MTMVSKAQAKAIYLLRNLAEDAKRHFKIKTKDFKVMPLEFNNAQKILHAACEAQKKAIGMVRILVLKGRQQGVSTYVCARFYAKASKRRATNVFINAHEQGSSDNLFEMVERIHENNPLAPETGAHNAKELVFSKLDSRYTVSIAGHKAGGRSRTTALYHGSEVAFWPNPEGHMASSVQSVPELPGTEIIFETTANGPSGLFYKMWREAERGESEYIAVFIPWFVQEEYRSPVPEDFVLSTTPESDGFSEVDYAEMFPCDDEQMMWRRNKIKTLGIDLFNQEYPATAEMAFVEASKDAFISPKAVLRARKSKIAEGVGHLVIGVDPAAEGGDRFVIIKRRGNYLYEPDIRKKVSTGEAIEWIHDTIKKNKDCVSCNIDSGHVGSSIISSLLSKYPEHKPIVNAVNFGGKSQHKMATPNIVGPKNRRAEMYTRMKEWFEGDIEVSIPDLDVVQSDITATREKFSDNGDTVLMSKKDMRAKGISSPDIADATALTFADTVYTDKKIISDRAKALNSSTRHHNSGATGWMGC